MIGFSEEKSSYYWENDRISEYYCRWQSAGKIKPQSRKPRQDKAVSTFSFHFYTKEIICHCRIGIQGFCTHSAQKRFNICTPLFNLYFCSTLVNKGKVFFLSVFKNKLIYSSLNFWIYILLQQYWVTRDTWAAFNSLKGCWSAVQSSTHSDMTSCFKMLWLATMVKN